MKGKRRNESSSHESQGRRAQFGRRVDADRYIFERDAGRDDRPPYYLQGPEDFDEFLEYIQRGGEDSGDEFVLRLIQNFIDAVYANERPRAWVMRYLADQFYKILHGGRWEDEFPLPWTKRSLPYSRAEWQSLGMFCDIANARRENPRRPITFLIREIAREWHVSYETARAAYYKHSKHLSKIPAKYSE